MKFLLLSAFSLLEAQLLTAQISSDPCFTCTIPHQMKTNDPVCPILNQTPPRISIQAVANGSECRLFVSGCPMYDIRVGGMCSLTTDIRPISCKNGYFRIGEQPIEAIRCHP